MISTVVCKNTCAILGKLRPQDGAQSIQYFNGQAYIYEDAHAGEVFYFVGSSTARYGVSLWSCIGSGGWRLKLTIVAFKRFPVMQGLLPESQSQLPLKPNGHDCYLKPAAYNLNW